MVMMEGAVEFDSNPIEVVEGFIVIVDNDVSSLRERIAWPCRRLTVTMVEETMTELTGFESTKTHISHCSIKALCPFDL